MSLYAALWASSTALTGKAALAFWTAAFLLQCLDSRKSVVVWQILLMLGALVGCILSGLYASGSVTLWMWIGGAFIAGFSAVQSIIQWTRTSPLETYEEASQLDPAINKPGSKKKSRPAQFNNASALKAQPAPVATWVNVVGLAIIAAAIAISICTVVSAPKSNAWISSVHILAACVLWGVGVFCAIELTFGSTPQSLSSVSWSGAAAVALGCWIVESCIAAFIVLSPVDSASEFQSVAMTRLFAISILLMDFVVWMIPHRVATFKRTGKAIAWVSLAMAAWIGVLSLAVLCALPSNWPWKHL